MKKTSLLLAVISLSFFYELPKAQASSFDTSYLRLNSQRPNVALSGTVCAKPSSPEGATEARVLVTFPNGFTISSNKNLWTTSTSNLPSGAIAWPGISSKATAVSGKTVAFSGSDLTAASLYCFNFSAFFSTTGSTGNDQNGTIATIDAPGNLIDLSSYALSIIGNDQISVTASINPQAADLPIAFSSQTSGSQFPQGSVITYKITYGSDNEIDIPLTIQAQWTEGTISGNPSPSVAILYYVVGSATNAYGASPPVIDTVSRTITWTVSSFPASTTNQTVTFSLKTNSSYTGGSVVSFDILARLISGSTTTPDQSVTQTYQYPSVSATPTPAPATATSAPTSSPAQTTSTPLSFLQISIRSLSQSQAQIYVETNNKSIFTIAYGLSLSKLSETVKTADFTTRQLVTLPELKTGTAYYFVITAKDENGNTIKSDIFTFSTSLLSSTLQVDTQTLVAASNNIILLSPGTKIEISALQSKNVIVIPVSTVFTVKFSLVKNVSLKEAQLIVRNKNVLGFNTSQTSDANSDYVTLTEISPGVYEGKLKSVATPGEYEIYARLTDFNGNITEQKISDLLVTRKFTVLEKGSGKPVENARVLLYLYNQTTKIYELISPQSISITNPSFSNPDGTVDLVLINGTYKAEISGIGYKPQTATFTINPSTGGYPKISLEAEPFNIVDVFRYYLGTMSDAITSSQIYIQQHANSSRLFDISTVGAIFIFVIISTLSISARTHVGVFYLPYFLLFKLTIIFKKNAGRIVFGQVVEKDTRIPISRVSVILMSSDGTQTIANLSTNKLGEFYYNNKEGKDFKITVAKEGYASPKPYDHINAKVKRIPVIFEVEKQGEVKHSLGELIIVYAEDLLGLCMEALILFGLLIQVYFIFTFGFLRITPFMLITILNLILIFAFLYKPRALSWNLC